MKNYKIVLLATVALVLASCGKWLTVNPQDQMKETELYSKADGFHTQINGIYRVMSGSSLYGRELSYGLIEVVAQVYDYSNYSTSSIYEYKNAAKYDYKYERTKAVIASMWEDSYNAITNCNSVINHAEVADSMLFLGRESERKCILGEAYALRAMLHFDIMRTFAPSLKVNSNGAFVPYQKTFPDRIPIKTHQTEYITNVINDLKKAHDLTGMHDTLNQSAITSIGNYLELSGSGGVNRFMKYRGYRLNHYAIKALLARVYLYAGDEENALKYAQQIIDLHTNKRFFRYNSSYEVYGDFNSKMYRDVIFAVYNNQLSKYYLEVNPVMEAGYSENFLTLLDVNTVFGADKDSDIRYKYLTKDIDGNQISVKYLDNSNGSTDQTPQISLKLVPMIRMSEVYYIAAECMYDKDRTKAQEYLTYVRGKRGVTTPLAANSTKDQFVQLILNDVRREQLCEGQLFFFYKRLNLPVYKKGTETLTLTDEQFSFPIPDSDNIL